MVSPASALAPASDPPVVLTAAAVRSGAWQLAPVAVFLIPFGVAASAHGLPAAQTVAMSLRVFSGSAQFAALNLWRHPMASGT